MPELEERVATLEGRVQEQATRMADYRDGITDVRQSVLDLRTDMGRVRDELRAEIGALREEMRGEIRGLRTEFGLMREEMDRRFDRIDQKFLWLVGIVVTACLATIATVAGAFVGLLQAIRHV